MIVVTGATGQLGRLVIDKLLLRGVPAPEVVAAVRDPAKAVDLEARGVQVRHADYDQPDTLARAFEGAERLLLISSSEIGRRAAQHRAVIDAAARAGVGLFGYTSVLHADRSPLGLAREHRETEAALKSSGLPHVLLRDGWYTENHTVSLPMLLAHGVMMGCAGAGRFSSAPRADYAAAAAIAMMRPDQAGRVYELAGDSAYTLAEFAAEVARQSGEAVVYKNLPQAEYQQALLGMGLPEPVAELVSDSEAGALRGALFDDGRQLSTLIGRPTLPMAETVAAALKGLNAPNAPKGPPTRPS